MKLVDEPKRAVAQLAARMDRVLELERGYLLERA